MHITDLEINGFRLLAGASLGLEKRTTVIVGRNNSGKTSLTELFRRILLDKSPTFRLEDFSLESHEAFWNASVLHLLGRSDEAVRAALPAIEARITVNYSDDADMLGPLAEFIVDLNPDCHIALIVVRYQLDDGKISALFEGLSSDATTPEDERKRDLCKLIKERVPELYKARLHAVDPNDESNRKQIDWALLQSLIQSGFINAQRGLDDATHRERDVLGKVLEALFTAAGSESADTKDKSAATTLDVAVQGIQDQIDTDFNKSLKTILPAFSLFGYPGLGDPTLRTETTLDVQRLLTNHTKVRYEGLNGVNLPEAYNGLGARNLIFILLQLVEFFKSFKAQQAAPGIHLVFIEEPEAHLHPQMAEVFIRKIEEIAEKFVSEMNDGVAWPVQFIVTTHSTHMANAARFETMRYFLAAPNGDHRHLRKTRIKDLRQGLSGTPENVRDFLHQYMTLTRCDLLFADKAALIEGCTERLLLPRMIAKVDEELPVCAKLSSQYTSVVEVGGAYAHLFFDLLEFLELRTLVITDIDSAQKNATGHRVACRVDEATHTTNACIHSWFGDIAPADLLSAVYIRMAGANNSLWSDGIRNS
ncbi:MAG: ATP-dependent endonuclease [Paludisphaera borealis]|uniref:ATP-dependent nuclease n=1 Tax=Paludisphaera borealis TaxID=1387353 RepID=UPI00284B8654|nr:ATP-dependent endonuclease [Paludisphaera borealis]MDR3623071.1 ATP-dependent endonuclease [Paludisphaera borealis]